MSECSGKILVEFAEEERIVHLSATEVLRINTEEKLNDLCGCVQERLESFGPEKVYMIVDLSKFSIEPNLAEVYGQKIAILSEHFLYPEGLARYGYQITRVTIMIADESDPGLGTGMFGTREEAFRYIRSLIKARSAGKIDLLAPECD